MRIPPSTTPAMVFLIRRIQARPLPPLSRRGYDSLCRATNDIVKHAVLREYLNATPLSRARTLLTVTPHGQAFAALAYDSADIVKVVNGRLSPDEEKAHKFAWAMMVFHGSFPDGRNDLEKAWGHEMSIAHLVTCGVAVAPSVKPRESRSSDGAHGSTKGLEGDISCRCSYRACVREFNAPRIFLDMADIGSGLL